ncbi:hypothetical protein [Microbacterium terricola]|uniref:WxL domain-containing protein n=1 Tax=Microbacterium terricola TaxID=344163 RepID=A0ABM8E359_9MICO|nr:hypothetical protein [Microbacterium terricola]UYK40077.1 hypothetical protein OAU46_00035 [Microbacterium terricola]BDV32226.1 hypothetical protein Microterr_28860 [Microbacterium terricola]
MNITSKKLTASFVAVGLIAAGVLGTSLSASAAGEPDFYLLDAGDGHLLADDQVLAWEDQVISSPGKTIPDLDIPFPGTADATGATLFISPVGQETTIANWSATGDSSLVPGTVGIQSPNLTLSGFTKGNWAGVKAGGTYSLGFAWTKNNGLNLADAGVLFTTIVVQPGGAGNWTFADQSGPVVEPPAHCDEIPTPDDCLKGDIDLEATTVGAEDGALSLEVPAGAKATFGTATLVNHLSTSTAELPEFSVVDERIVSRPGWTLTADVADFTSGSSTFGAEHLGLAPTLVTDAHGAELAAAQTAGSGVYPADFAAADAGKGIGETTFSADLTLVAPVDAPAGTYTSKLTLTLIGD